METLSANGSTAWGTFNNDKGVIIVAGNFGSGTATVELRDDSGAAVSTTASGTVNFAELVHTGKFAYRVTLSGASSPSLNISVSNIKE